MVNLDAAIEYLGEFGLYQRSVYFTLLGPAAWVGAHNLVYVFLAGVPKHRCFVPGLDNETHPQYSAINFSQAIPWDSDAEDYDSCRRYARNYNSSTWDNETQTIACDKGWVYDHSQYTSTVVSDFDLVCDDEYKVALTSSMYMAGILVGSVLFGELSDRIGRLTVLYLCLVLLLMFGILCAFMPEYISFTITRFLVGAATMGVYLALFVLALEMVGDKARTPCGVGCQAFFAVGFMLDGLLAYFIRDWMWLQLAITLPGAGFLCYLWILPESVRWLVANKKYQKAERIVRKAGKVNKLYLPEHVFTKEHITETNVKHTVIDLFRTPNIRTRSLVLFFVWFVSSLTYYGLSLNAADLVGDIYLNFVLLGAVEIPGYALCVLAMECIGRRLSLALSMIIGGVACVGAGFVKNEDIGWLSTTLALTGKMFLAGSFAIAYNYSIELYPTLIRNTGLGMCSMSARIGGILAPQIILLDSIAKYMDTLIMGCMGIVGGSLAFILPETKGMRLPETLAEGEQFGKKQSGMGKLTQNEKHIDDSYYTKSYINEALGDNYDDHGLHNHGEWF